MIFSCENELFQKKLANHNRDLEKYTRSVYNENKYKNFSRHFIHRKKSEKVTAIGQDVIDNVSALKRLLAPNCNKNALSRLPAGVVTDKVLIVDMLTIKDDWQDDHRWMATSGPKEKKYKVTFHEERNMIVCPTGQSNDVYRVKCHRFVHDSARDFHRVVITVSKPDGSTHPFALVQYRFDGEPHAVENRPHGNSKNSLPLVPTKKSTLEKLSTVLKEHSSIKRAVHIIEDDEGGLMAASQSSIL